MILLKGKTLEKYKEGLKLNETQKALIIGSILGDGTLRIPGRNNEANFTADHGEQQKGYVFWKYKMMKEWVLTSPRQYVRSYHKDRTRKTISWRFSTIAHPELTKLYRIFYPNGKKILPDSIKDLLIHPLSLAIWAMDDGTKSGESFFFSTQNFTQKEQEVLIKCLKENFGIDGKINLHSYWEDKIFYRIRINSCSLEKLCKLIEPHILPQFQYKFSLCPRNDLLNRSR